MNRREFIQRGLALAATLSLGVRIPRDDERLTEIDRPDGCGEGGNQIALVGFGIDADDFAQCIELFDFCATIENRMHTVSVKSRLDVNAALDAAYFIDANGNRYPYRVIERAVEAQGHLMDGAGMATTEMKSEFVGDGSLEELHQQTRRLFGV